MDVNKRVKSRVSVYDARCQDIINPVGIAELHPSFSWKIFSNKRAVMQTAYQITVASSLQNIETDPDMWNSGKVNASENAFIHYQGRLLESGKKYYWKVKIWVNNEPRNFEAKPSDFVTGLLQKNEWKDAEWIAYKKLPDSMKVFPGLHGNGNQLGKKAMERAVIPYFRKDFQINKQIAHAYVFACGLGQYVLYVNGHRIDSSFLNPTWSDYTKRCYYNSYDITSFIKDGGNTIASIVGPGFLYINRERYRKLTIAAGYPMMRLKMIIRYVDGSTQKVVTDQSWKTSPSAITYSSIYGGEDFNANKIKKGWNKPGFNDTNWQIPVIVPGPGGEMDAQEAYPVVINQKFQPVRIDSSKSKIWLYDFGQNTSGITRLKASAPKGYRIEIIPAELINKDQSLDQAASGYPYYWEYTFKGNGIEEWQPLFSYYGFRYAGVKVFDKEGNPISVNNVNISSLTLLHTQNGSPKVGTFSCSDTLFNQIFELIQWGIRNNMSNVSTDCPHREKLGWLEQAHLMGNSIQYNYDILRFYVKIIKDMEDAQLPNGLIPDIAPEYVVFNDGFRDSPEWGSACVLVPWYLYQWYGNKEVLLKSYVMMKKYVQYLSNKSDHYLLAYGLGDWCDLGPRPYGVSQLTPPGVTATSFYYYDAKILGKIATILNKPNEAEKYISLADSIRCTFNKKFFNPDTKVYATGSQASYAIPLYFGIAPEKYRTEILANLVDSIIAYNYALTAGDIGFRHLIQALEEGGYSQVIYKMNNREDVPGYGYQIKKGATALTESWQALRTLSNDHMMLGHLMEWFYSGLGGIRQQAGSIGYKKILIAPQFVKGINWVNSTYNSINGPIVVSWKYTGKSRIQLKVTIPANTIATIMIPSKNPELIQKNGYRLKRKQDNGIYKIMKEEMLTKIKVGSGQYNLSFQLWD